MKKKLNKRTNEVQRLIDLYDAFRMAEFMDQSVDCDDVNVRALRRLCFSFGRFGDGTFDIDAWPKADVKQLTDLATAGDPVAQATLAQCYHCGFDVEIDLSKAAHLFERSAAQGYVRGMAGYGKILVEFDTPEFREKGFSILRNAVEKGCAVAMVNLGAYLLSDAKDEQEIEGAKRLILKGAKKQFEQAANKGVVAAQCLLGECYYKGHGCDVDMDKAFYWFNEAAKQNEFQALGWLGVMYYDAKGCKRNVRKSVSYNKRAAVLGNEGAQQNLALTYLGLYDGLPFDPEKAVDMLWPLACRGRPLSIEMLGECYVKGLGVKRDVERGLGLLAVAARFRDCNRYLPYVIKRQTCGYLRFYEAAVSRLDENNIEPSILKMLSDYDEIPS